jgi:hypothetical protein
LPHLSTMPLQGLSLLRCFPFICSATVFQIATLTGFPLSELFPSEDRYFSQSPSSLTVNLHLRSSSVSEVCSLQKVVHPCWKYFIPDPDTGSLSVSAFEALSSFKATPHFCDPSLLWLSRQFLAVLLLHPLQGFTLWKNRVISFRIPGSLSVSAFCIPQDESLGYSRPVLSSKFPSFRELTIMPERYLFGNVKITGYMVIYR